MTLGAGDRHWGEHIFTFAFDWERESGFLFDRLNGGVPNRARRDNFDGTFQYQAALGRLFLSNGLRVEDNGSFGRTVVPRSSAALLLRQGGGTLGATKLKFNFGLGIKEPSFTQSFSQDPAFLGNPDLRPERSRAFEAGVEQRLMADRAKIEVNWFDNNFRDLIAFQTLTFVPFTGTFLNINATHARGVEFLAQAVPLIRVHITAEYTYLSTRVEKSSTPTDPILGVGKPLLRRPKHSATFSAAYEWRKTRLSSNLVYVGRRADSDFEALFPPLTSNSPYTNWNAAGSYQVSKAYPQLLAGIRSSSLGDAHLRKGDLIWFPVILLGISGMVLTNVIYHRNIGWLEIAQMIAFASIALIGQVRRDRRSWGLLLGACMASSLSFFLIINFGYGLGGMSIRAPGKV
ncbi:MAG: hypothetical protein DMG63_01435 [Acidobacteria bacterium]|nr:MAG: hypothetical protein DMG63_01435 [Acidobacteriota bacterium]